MKTRREGEFWADKLMDLANFAIVALVFGQVVAEKINLVAVALGVLLFIILVSISRYLRRR